MRNGGLGNTLPTATGILHRTASAKYACIDHRGDHPQAFNKGTTISQAVVIVIALLAVLLSAPPASAAVGDVGFPGPSTRGKGGCCYGGEAREQAVVERRAMVGADV